MPNAQNSNKGSLKDIVQEHGQSFTEATQQAEEKIRSAVLDTAHSLQTEAKSFIEVVQEQVKEFQDDVHDQVGAIKEKLSHSKETLLELKDSLLHELKYSASELNQLGQEIKGEVQAITVKSKAHFAESYQRIKGNVSEPNDQPNTDEQDKNQQDSNA
ncbi:hypothetical protein [Acinetobacter gerneri]|uniref:hypothetical protein n=1 Tax=Acinetobacter gerneri TaxID=202952 RepID=UPI003213C7CB